MMIEFVKDPKICPTCKRPTGKSGGWWDCGMGGEKGHRHTTREIAKACLEKRKNKPSFERRFFSSRNRSILLDRRSGLTFREIGKKYGLSVERTRCIYLKMIRVEKSEFFKSINFHKEAQRDLAKYGPIGERVLQKRWVWK